MAGDGREGGSHCYPAVLSRGHLESFSVLTGQLSHSLLAGCSQPPEPSCSSPQCPRGDPRAVAVKPHVQLGEETGEG